ncbi:MAG: M16 family metallopeptidase [Syntrophothermus sp.]
MKIQRLTLPNGIRLVHQHNGGNVAHCGVLLNTGSRDESESEHGIAHFIEHVIFKGTEKRDVFQVLNRLEDVGADLNAYTTKEDTCVYASFLNRYYERTLELISDVLFHSTFPREELEKEKVVVIDEIKSYKDSPGDQIIDDFEDLVFSGHSLGRNILGTPGNIRRLKGNDIRNFILNNYNTDQIVISSIGNISFQRITALVLKYFGGIPASPRKAERVPFNTYQPVKIIKKRKIFQTHCTLGGLAYSAKAVRRFPLSFLNNILGGPTLNSRLSLALREKNGLTYNIESNYTPYTDTGIITIYFGTGSELLEKALSITHQELAILRERKMSETALNKARKQLIGQMAIGQESKASQMLANGKSILVNDEIIPFPDLVMIVENITASQLMETANEIFPAQQLSSLIFQS